MCLLVYTHHYEATVSTPLYKEYKLISIKNGQRLTDMIQIKADEVMNVDSPEYWLHYFIGRKWSKQALSPLFNTSVGNIYHGSTKPTDNTLLFRFTNENLTIFYYPNFSSLGNEGKLKQLIDSLQREV